MVEYDDKEKKGVLKEDVFFRYFSENQNEIFSYILTLVPNSADADDIFQGMSSVMWRKFEEFKPGTDFSSWGCKIAYYIILDHRRKMARNPIRYSSATLELLSKSYSVYRKDKKNRVDQLANCLRNLSEKERFLVQLRYNQSLSVKIIAERIGKSINMIYKSLAKIHYFLYECVQRKIAVEERS